MTWMIVCCKSVTFQDLSTVFFELDILFVSDSHNQPYVIPPPRQRRRMTRDAGDQSARQEHSIPSRTNTGQQGSRNSVRVSSL